MNLPAGDRGSTPRARSRSTRRSGCSSPARVAVRPDFKVTNENAPAVAGICARLHGMPLAIELAAARVKLLPPEAILERLEHQLGVLSAGSRDLPERQQTLRGAIAWSYDLLGDGERRLLGRLSVFVGGCELDSAEAGLRPAARARRRRRRSTGSIVARRPEPRPGRGGRRRAALPDARHDPRVRLGAAWRRAASATRSSGATRRPSSTLAETPTPEAVGRRPAALARPARARSRQHPGGPRSRGRGRRRIDGRSGSGSRCGATGRSAATSAEARRRLQAIADAPWSRDDPRPAGAAMEALGGVGWWQADIDAMMPGLCRGARDLASRSATSARSRTRSTTTRSSTPSRATDPEQRSGRDGSA